MFEPIKLETCLFFSLHRQDGAQVSETINGQVKLKRGKSEKEETGQGSGPIDAVFNCIVKIVNSDDWKLFPGELVLSYLSITSEGNGSSATGKIVVKIDHILLGQRISHEGEMHHTDINYAAALAIIQALNHILERLYEAGAEQTVVVQPQV